MTGTGNVCILKIIAALIVEIKHEIDTRQGGLASLTTSLSAALEIFLTICISKTE